MGPLFDFSKGIENLNRCQLLSLRGTIRANGVEHCLLSPPASPFIPILINFSPRRHHPVDLFPPCKIENRHLNKGTFSKKKHTRCMAHRTRLFSRLKCLAWMSWPALPRSCSGGNTGGGSPAFWGEEGY